MNSRAEPAQLALFGEHAGAPTEAATPPAPGLRRFDDGRHGFDYRLVRASRRSVGIRVGDDGVAVRAPRWVTLQQVHAVLAEKAAWIDRQLNARAQRQRALAATQIAWREGGGFPYLGRQLTLRVGAAVATAQLRDTDLLLPLPAGCEGERVRDSAQAWMQREARALFDARCAHFARQLGVRVRAVRLSSAATRWGSATACGTIRLHWRLLHFSPAVIDYVVAHEVAHLREMNHGPEFWETVEELFPPWRDARSELRRSLLPPW